VLGFETFDPIVRQEIVMPNIVAPTKQAGLSTATRPGRKPTPLHSTARQPQNLGARLQQTPQQLDSTDITYLQQTAGNQAVARLLQRPATPANVPALQAKLTVGPVHDRYEDEADRIAHSVSGASMQATSASVPAAHAQRTPAAAPQAPIGAAGGAVDVDTAQSIRRAQGGGKRLDATLRAPIEQKLHTDLSHARVHVGAQADDLNGRVGARAFTTGADIFVQRDEYRPGTQAGRALLYHELTHVHQQTGGTVSQVQRAISNKSNAFQGIWDQLYAGPKAAGQKQAAESYLAGFDTKPQDRQARRAQSQEAKQMKAALHFGRKQTDTSTEGRCEVFRAILTGERARGQSFVALQEFKEFMIKHPTTAAGEEAQDSDVGDGDYIAMVQGNAPTIKRLVGLAEADGASPALLNLFYTHNPKIFNNMDKKIVELTPQINKIVPEAKQFASTSTQSAVIRLGSMSTQLAGLLTNLNGARARNEYVQAKALLSQMETLFETVWQLTTYARMGARSNLSSNKEIGESKRLGGGMFSKVSEVNYDPTASIQHGVFKQEARGYKAGDSPAASASGIAEVDSNFGGRSVASYKVDKLLGTGVVPKTKFGTHKGAGGTVQDWAKGQSPQKTTTAPNAPPVNQYRDFDYSDPEIQRQLSTLQLFDAITGQVDRHPGNYYIYQGPGGTQVTAIDNDLAFGENKDVERVIDPVWLNRPLANDQSRGVPLFVDESIAEQILNTTANDLKATISGMLTPQEVTKTLARFAKVKIELQHKKENTERIKPLYEGLEVLAELLKKRGGDISAEQEERIKFHKNRLLTLLGQGALIDRSGWGQVTATYLTQDNSYFGMVVGITEQNRQVGRVIPVE
jgi:hypothetical protein